MIVINGSTGLTLPNGNVITSATVSANNGTAALPNYTGTDTDTGMWFPDVNTVAISTAGVERMRIDSSGNVTGATITSPTFTGVTAFPDGTAAAPSIHRVSDTNTGVFFPAADTVAATTGGTERMRVDSSGNVGIGTTNSVGKLTVCPASNDGNVGAWGNGQFLVAPGGTTGSTGLGISVDTTANVAYFSALTPTVAWRSLGYRANQHLFYYGGTTEAMRINSSGGELLLNRTTLQGTERFSIEVDGSKQGQCIRSTNTSGNPNIFRIAAGQFSGGMGTGRFITCDDGGGDKFFVAGSGTVNSTSTSITSISDQRLKENVRDLETGLPEIMQLKPRRFDWMENQGTGKKNVVGFIAQEVETVLPDLIGEWKNQDDETIYKSLAMGDMLPTLVKAIQELKAENDTLKARLDAANL